MRGRLPGWPAGARRCGLRDRGRELTWRCAHSRQRRGRGARHAPGRPHLQAIPGERASPCHERLPEHAVPGTCLLNIVARERGAGVMPPVPVLSDERWPRIAPLGYLPLAGQCRPRSVGVAGPLGIPPRRGRCAHRQVEAIVQRYRACCAWRDPPAERGPWQTISKRHRPSLRSPRSGKQRAPQVCDLRGCSEPPRGIEPRTYALRASSRVRRGGVDGAAVLVRQSVGGGC